MQAHRDWIDPAALSAALRSEVQLFVTHRVVEAHGWERAIGGRSIRSFEYIGESGEVTRWRGDPDDVELAIGLPRSFDIDRDSVADHGDVAVCEADVIRVAAAWSVDPTTLEGRPASQPLTVVQLPLEDHPQTVPVAQPMAVDITDLIGSSTSYEDFQRKMAGRLRERRGSMGA